MEKNIFVKEIQMPFIEKPKEEYVFLSEDFERRHNQIRKLMNEKKLDYLIIYGDQLLFSNIYHLTGVDLKFEEALLIISLNEDPVFISGIEMLPYLEYSPYKSKIKGLLYEPFSLQGMPHSKSFNLETLLKKYFKNNKKIGFVGNKYYPYLKNSNKIFDSPFYIIALLQDIAGKENIVNATDIMTHSVYGIRNNLFPKDLAFMEYSERMLCYAVKNTIDNLRIGMNAVEAASYFYYSKEMPFSVPFGMVFGGDIGNITFPKYSSILKEGDFVLLGSTIRGASMARCGIAVDNLDKLNIYKKDILEEFYIPYYRNIMNWYENIKIGKKGGEIYNIVKDFVENPIYSVELNPGHLTHLYEWVNSPFYKGSMETLHSGMVVQCELISYHKKYNIYLMLEEGLVLADSKLQNELKVNYPMFLDRANKRKKFMFEVLGLRLDESVLPLSDIQAILNPFFLNNNFALTIEK